MSVIELSWTSKNLSMGKQCFSVNLINCNSDFCCSYSAISRCDHFGKCWCYSRWIWKDRSCVTLIKLESKPWTLCFLWTMEVVGYFEYKISISLSFWIDSAVWCLNFNWQQGMLWPTKWICRKVFPWLVVQLVQHCIQFVSEKYRQSEKRCQIISRTISLQVHLSSFGSL